jgi:hemoglobin
MSQRSLNPLCDQIGRPAVERVVAAFYRRLRDDPMLGALFQDLPAAHEQRICDFWWTAMGGRLEQPPVVDMVGTHLPLGLTQPMIETWLGLFRDTLAEELDEDLAGQWYQMANAIAGRLLQFVVRGSPPVPPPSGAV